MDKGIDEMMQTRGAGYYRVNNLSAKKLQHSQLQNTAIFKGSCNNFYTRNDQPLFKVSAEDSALNWGGTHLNNAPRSRRYFHSEKPKDRRYKDLRKWNKNRGGLNDLRQELLRFNTGGHSLARERRSSSSSSNECNNDNLLNTDRETIQMIRGLGMCASIDEPLSESLTVQKASKDKRYSSMRTGCHVIPVFYDESFFKLTRKSPNNTSNKLATNWIKQ